MYETDTVSTTINLRNKNEHYQWFRIGLDVSEQRPNSTYTIYNILSLIFV